MKKLTFTFVLLFGMMFSGSSQQKSNVTIYSEDKEPFYVYINTIKRNDQPYSKLELTSIPEGTYRIRIKFDKNNILPVERSLHFKAGRHSTYKLVKRREAKDQQGQGKGQDNKGHKAKYTLKFESMTPIADDDQANQGGNDDESGDDGNQSGQNGGLNGGDQGDDHDEGQDEDEHADTGSDDDSQASSSEGHHDHHHTENCGHPSHGSGGYHQHSKSISIKIEMGQTGHGQGHEHPQQEHPTSGSSEDESSGDTEENTPDPEPEKEYLPGYNGEVGCTPPMSESEFRDAKSSISDKTFENTKLKVAKQVTKSHCLLSSQVEEVMNLFTYENTRLEYAKFAYDYTYDLDNYYKVNDAFEYESSIDELNEYID